MGSPSPTNRDRVNGLAPLSSFYLIRTVPVYKEKKMKKSIIVLCVLLSIGHISAQTPSLFTVTTPSGHTVWCAINYPSQGQASIGSAGGSYSGTLIIPDSIVYLSSKYPVTHVGYVSGYENSHNYVSGGSFSQCGLTSVLFPSTVVAIVANSFISCTSLQSVSFNSGLCTIGNRAFEGCNSLTSVTLPASVSSVGSGAFGYCTSLSSLTLSANAPISNGEFQGCTNLTNVVIPNGVTSIGSMAFLGCTNLTQISLPNSVHSIGTSAFSGCTSLHNLVLPNALPGISENMCLNCTSMENVTIPNAVTYIQTGAFSGCTHLFNVTVPNSVLSIETNAFDGVWNVAYNGTATGATWGAHCVNGYIQDSILYNNSSKTTLIRAHWNVHSANIPSTVNAISSEAFSYCTNIANLSIDSNIQTIGTNAFQGCTGLTTLTYNTPASVSGLFSGCSSLSNVTLGNYVTSIANNMFYDCSSLNTSPLTNNIQTIGQSAFYNTNLSTVTIPQSCTSIGYYAFRNCPLSTVTALPATPPAIGSNVFTANPTIIIPCGSANAYRSSWYQYSSLITEPIVDFALNVLAGEGGQAQVTNNISCADSMASIQATSNYGFIGVMVTLIIHGISM